MTAPNDHDRDSGSSTSSTSSSDDQSTLAVSPALIVGIVILAAFAVTVVSASVFRYCRRSDRSPSAAAARAGEAYELDVDADWKEVYNPNRVRSTAQATRMKEVRWINNMHAWERGRQARMETGELRPPTVLPGRSGQNRSWDEYTVGDHHSSGREVSSHRLDGPFSPWKS